MKKNIKLLSIAIAMVVFSSCTDRFEQLNTDPTTQSNDQLSQDFNNVKSLITQMQNSVVILNPAWQTQLQQNLNADVYSGYLTPPTPFAGNINNTNYKLVDGWNGFIWSIAYGNVMTPALVLKSRTESTSPFYAWSLILKVEAMHRVTDVFGPIVYSDFGRSDADRNYDTQKDVYYAMFNELTTATEILKPLVGKPSTFVGTDLVYGGDYTKWIKFANSLRLRLAMRISKSDPAKAKLEAEKAVSDAIGVIMENNEAAFVTNTQFDNPLKTLAVAFEDTRMAAPMESILKGYTDPRLPIYFDPSESVPGDYKGIRQGIDIKAKATYLGYSLPGKAIINNNAVQWMSCAEVYFLRAEGALRGWNMAGQAGELYNAGIAKSFSQYGIANVAAYQNVTTTAANYVDTKNASNSTAGVNKVGVKWDMADSNELKLQKIITQKWIAMFPNGQEAWSEFRRTGYPKLFPVVINNSGGTISTTDFIRRINFFNNEVSLNPGIKTAYKALGGTDKSIDTGGTRLWWDTGSNF